ncbi:MAG: metal-dependent transcriptional regulator [Pseudomonadota bacterium]
MSEIEQQIQLTGALEDYLETIYELVRDQRVARVKDIARARKVRAASVTPAMRRLSDLGLIHYAQREFIDLTPEGEEVARRVFARHQLLNRFFEDILQMEPSSARADACAMEHSLSAGGLDHLARFFEFLNVCPEGSQFLTKFHRCSLVHEDSHCETDCPARKQRRLTSTERSRTLPEIAAGARARVTQIADAGNAREHLLNMGLLPDVELEVLHRGAQAIRIRIQGYELDIPVDEAGAVLVQDEA